MNTKHFIGIALASLLFWEYNVDYGVDNRVIQIRLAGKTANELGTGSMVWR